MPQSSLGRMAVFLGKSSKRPSQLKSKRLKLPGARGPDGEMHVAGLVEPERVACHGDGWAWPQRNSITKIRDVFFFSL